MWGWHGEGNRSLSASGSGQIRATGVESAPPFRRATGSQRRRAVMCGTHSRALCAGGTAKGIAREARVPRGPGFATAERSRHPGECRGGCGERTPRTLMTRGGGSQRNARRCVGWHDERGKQRRGLLSERPLVGGPSRSHEGPSEEDPGAAHRPTLDRTRIERHFRDPDKKSPGTPGEQGVPGQ